MIYYSYKDIAFKIILRITLQKQNIDIPINPKTEKFQYYNPFVYTF